MKQPLKPCPFCGADGRVAWRDLKDDAEVGCSSETCRAMAFVAGSSDDEVIAIWNRRDGEPKPPLFHVLVARGCPRHRPGLAHDDGGPLMVGTEQYFRDRILEADSLAEVNFDTEIPMAVRIRPSHPRYRDAVVAAALEHKPMGMLAIVTREVDEIAQYPDPPLGPMTVRKLPAGKSWWKRLIGGR